MNIILLLSICVFALTAPAAEFGTFVLVKGQVKVEYQNGSVSPAKVSAKIGVGDTIVTSEDSRAKIVVFGSRNIINILPNTKLKLQQIAQNKDTKNIELNLVDGKIRANVGDRFEGASKFEVRTTTAVAGVRGTQFIVSFSSANKITEVVTIRGVVSVTNLSQNLGDNKTASEVLVKKGQKSSVAASAAPSAPTNVETKDLNQINIDTTVEKDEGGASLDGDSAKGAEVAGDDSAGFVNVNPISTPNTLRVNGAGVPQRRITPVKINIK